MPRQPPSMKTPFYLGGRSLILFEEALRDVGRDELRLVLDQVSSKQSPDCNPRKQKLVEAEIARRKSADAAGFFAIFFALLSFLSLLLH